MVIIMVIIRAMIVLMIVILTMFPFLNSMWLDEVSQAPGGICDVK